MSTLTIADARTGHRTRTLARLCVLAGLLGAASGVALIIAPAAVEDTRYSYPLSAGAFVAIQIWFAVQHLGLLAGLVALGRVARGAAWLRGARLAAAGMVALAATEVLAVSAARADHPDGWLTGALDAAYGLATLAIAAGLIVAGAAVVRTRSWRPSRRWIPLVTGVYAIVPMSPLIAAGFLAARLSITGWMLLFALLGWALLREDGM